MGGGAVLYTFTGMCSNFIIKILKYLNALMAHRIDFCRPLIRGRSSSI